VPPRPIDLPDRSGRLFDSRSAASLLPNRKERLGPGWEMARTLYPTTPLMNGEDVRRRYDDGGARRPDHVLPD
jgi:hypothetical protein